MKYRKLGASDLECLGNLSRLMADLWRRRGARPRRGLRRPRLRSRDQFHRYGQCLWPGCGGELPGRDSRLAAAQFLHPGDQGLFSHERHRQRIVAGADPEADRRLAAAAAGRSCRSLSMPPLRQRDAARGDHGRPERGGAPGQGPLHRLQRMVGGADRGGLRASRAASISSPASRNIPCSGAAPRRRSSRFARPRASRRSSGRRWRRAC